MANRKCNVNSKSVHLSVPLGHEKLVYLESIININIYMTSNLESIASLR
jgi:hypothetical protein